MSNHEWCRDTARDEAVRAAEDAAAVPEIMHRDLPEQVALLWASLGDIIGRVVRLEGEMDAAQDEEAAPAEGIRKERGESVCVVEWTKRGRLPDMVARLTAERDAAIRERDEALLVLPACCGRLSDAAATVVQERDHARSRVAELLTDCETFERAVLALQGQLDLALARVAELEAAAPPRGWLTAEEREAVEEAMVDYASNVGDHDCERIERVLRALLARSTPPKVKVPSELMLCEARGVRIVYDAGKVKRAIRAAGGEVEG